MFAAGEQLVTMADIARSLGVSVQTVSAVVNGKQGISEATQRRVRDAVDRSGFTPNQQARTLRGLKSKTIGVIIPSITNPYFPEFVKGIEEEARKTGHSIFLCNTDENIEHLVDYLTLITTNKASGLICSLALAGDWLDHPEIKSRFQRFAREEVGVVLVGPVDATPPLASVSVSDEAAIGEACRHLLELGHRDIGIVSPPAGFKVTDLRVSAFRRALAALGHPVDDSMVVPGDFDMDAGIRGAERLMRKRRKPTAIIAANDLAAFGVIAGLSRMGLSVPRDVSVLGFDDIAFARVFQPALSTIAQPLRELGRAAFRLVTNEASSSAQKVKLQAQFVARSSTGAAP